MKKAILIFLFAVMFSLASFTTLDTRQVDTRQASSYGLCCDYILVGNNTEYLSLNYIEGSYTYSDACDVPIEWLVTDATTCCCGAMCNYDWDVTTSGDVTYSIDYSNINRISIDITGGEGSISVRHGRKAYFGICEDPCDWVYSTWNEVTVTNRDPELPIGENMPDVGTVYVYSATNHAYPWPDVEWDVSSFMGCCEFEIVGYYGNYDEYIFVKFLDVGLYGIRHKFVYDQCTTDWGPALLIYATE